MNFFFFILSNNAYNGVKKLLPNGIKARKLKGIEKFYKWQGNQSKEEKLMKRIAVWTLIVAIIAAIAAIWPIVQGWLSK